MRLWSLGSKTLQIKIYRLLPILLLIYGCEDTTVYSNFIDIPKSIRIGCVSLSTFDPKLTQKLREEFVSQKECRYSIRGYIHYVNSCNNPDVKSLGADFNGYVRLSVLDGNTSIYRVQSDFQNSYRYALKRVINRMKLELFQKNSFN
jgi:hypothetical protein